MVFFIFIYQYITHYILFADEFVMANALFQCLGATHGATRAPSLQPHATVTSDDVTHATRVAPAATRLTGPGAPAARGDAAGAAAVTSVTSAPPCAK